MKKLLTIFFSMYAILLFIIILLLTFPIVLLIICLPKKQRDKAMFLFLRIVSNVWMYGCFMFPKNFSAKELDKKNTQIIIANHASYIDAPVLYTCITALFKTLGKEELARVPIFKYIIKSAVITVNRMSTMARAKSFLQMQQEVENGLNVVFFPEGTFNENQEVLKSFFDGAFHMAIKTQKNILPLLLIHTNKRMQANTIFGFTPGKSHTLFLPAIPIVGLKIADTEMLKAYCYNYMNTILQYCKNHDAATYDAFVKEYISKNPFII